MRKKCNTMGRSIMNAFMFNHLAATAARAAIYLPLLFSIKCQNRSVYGYKSDLAKIYSIFFLENGKKTLHHEI